MPGISRSTSLALDFISSLPEEDQKVAREIYFTYESLWIWKLTPFFASLVISTAVLFAIDNLASDYVSFAFTIAICIVAFIISYVWIGKATKKPTYKNVIKIRSLAKHHPNGQDILTKLKVYSVNFKGMCEEFNL